MWTLVVDLVRVWGERYVIDEGLSCVCSSMWDVKLLEDVNERSRYAERVGYPCFIVGGCLKLVSLYTGVLNIPV